MSLSTNHSLIAILFFCGAITACAPNDQKSKITTKNIQVDSIIQPKQPAANTGTIKNDTLIVEGRSVVFIEPDSLQTEKRKKAVGEENFYIGADDYLYYLNIAIKFTDSLKLKSVHNNGKKLIKFIKSNQSGQVINTDTLPELWNVYFFDPAKNPKAVDMTIIEEEYKTYFK